MSLILTGTVRRVADAPVEEKNRETGAISNVWKMQIENIKANGEFEMLQLKAKSEVQAAGWRRFLNKQISVPVNQYAANGKPGVWIEAGQLPSPAVTIPQTTAAA